MKLNSSYWIEKLDLEKHPEGGYFKEVYRSDEFLEKENLPARFHGKRCFATSIYFLLNNDNISSFHRIKSDETWHFYYGNPVIIYIIDEKENLLTVSLGNNPEKGEVLQFTVPKNCWFAASISDENKETGFGYCLVGCTVAPGFDFEDFEMGERNILVNEFPQYENIIVSHTY
jgi:hypothetical protein